MWALLQWYNVTRVSYMVRWRHECCTCSLHASLVQDAVQDIAAAILILLLEYQGCDFNQEAG